MLDYLVVLKICPQMLGTPPFKSWNLLPLPWVWAGFRGLLQEDKVAVMECGFGG